MAVNQTTFAGLLKRHYSKQKVLNLAYQTRPLFAMIPKRTDWGGSSYDLPIIYGDPVAGRSANFTNGNTNRSSAQVRNDVFVLTSTQNYNQTVVAGETLAAGKVNGGQDVFINALKAPIVTGKP